MIDKITLRLGSWGKCFMKANNDYFTTHQAASLLHSSVRTIQLWADSGRLKCWVSPGGHRRIEKESVMNLLNSGEMTAKTVGDMTTKNILIVEDDEDLVLLYRMQFKQWQLPVEVRYAPNGFVGLVEIGKLEPDLLITDLLMPDINGIEMLKSLTGAGLHIPTIAITGASTQEIQQLQDDDEDLLILSKPVDFSMLRRLISTMLDLRKTPKELPANE